MPRLIPYLQRRGYGLTFRIAVPADLHPIIGVYEITKSLPTADRCAAVPMALEYAACVKRMYSELRAGMSAPDNNEEQRQAPDLDKLREVVRQAKHRIQLDDFKEQHQNELIEQRRQHLRELDEAKLKAENEALKRVLAGFQASPISKTLPLCRKTPLWPLQAPLCLHRQSIYIVYPKLSPCGDA